MKKIAVILMLLTAIIYGQSATVSVDENSTITGDTVTVAINIKDFTDVASLTIHIKYDTNVLEWGKVSNVNNQFVDMLDGASDNKVILAWYSVVPQSVSDAKLLDLKFKYKGGISSIEFDIAASQITNLTTPIAVNYVNGTVGNPTIPGKVKLISPLADATFDVGEINFVWNNISSASSYAIQVSDIEDFSNLVYENSIVPDTLISVSDLGDGVKYYWRAAAINSAGTGEFSDMSSFSIKLNKASDLTAEEVNSLTELNWIDNSLNEDGYYIYRKESVSDDFVKYDSVGTDVNNYVDSSVVLNGNYIYAVRAFNSQFISELSNETEITIVTDIEEETIPSEFKLDQNYPNPFNPKTVVSYSVAKNSRIKISVFDTLGKEIKNLVNENKAPGNYSVNFDGTYLSSGTYIIKMSTDSFTKSVKALLVK